MKTKHTPGEWHVEPANPLKIFSTPSISALVLIADVSSFENCLGRLELKKEAEANAKLISAAPENLEDNIEWVSIHQELLKLNIKIPKTLSDKIMNQLLKSKESITKATQ